MHLFELPEPFVEISRFRERHENIFLALQCGRDLEDAVMTFDLHLFHRTLGELEH